MATLFTTMIATLKGGAAAGAAAGAGSGAAAGAGLSTISTAATVIGGLSSIMSGVMSGNAKASAAVQEDTQAVQETLQGKQDALTSLRALNQDSAQILSAGFASGIGGEGSVATAQEEASRIADQNFTMSRTDAALKASARRGQADQYRKDARGSRWGGLFRAASGGLELYQRREVRG